MLEVVADLFQMDPADVGLICIPCNGVLNWRGENPMGGGPTSVAEQAKKRWPGIEREIGERLKAPDRSGGGNHVHLLTERNDWGSEGDAYLVSGDTRTTAPFHVASFPTKKHWKDKADLDLIRQSLFELRALVDRLDSDPKETGFRDKRIALPRVGAGLGRVPWDVIRVVVQAVLPGDRWLVVARSP